MVIRYWTAKNISCLGALKNDIIGTYTTRILIVRKLILTGKRLHENNVTCLDTNYLSLKNNKNTDKKKNAFKNITESCEYDFYRNIELTDETKRKSLSARA